MSVRQENLMFDVDFSRIFKNGGLCRVKILHWYVTDGAPKAVVAIVDEPDEGDNPKVGEVLKVSMKDLRYYEDGSDKWLDVVESRAE